MRKILILLCCLLCIGCQKEIVKDIYGTYYSDSEECMEGYRPSLTLKKDNTFIFYENLYSGMGELRGTFVQKENQYILTIESHTIHGHLGDHLEIIPFTIQEDGSLLLEEDICLSRKKDCFYQK